MKVYKISLGCTSIISSAQKYGSLVYKISTVKNFNIFRLIDHSIFSLSCSHSLSVCLFFFVVLPCKISTLRSRYRYCPYIPSARTTNPPIARCLLDFEWKIEFYQELSRYVCMQMSRVNIIMPDRLGKNIRQDCSKYIFCINDFEYL